MSKDACTIRDVVSRLPALALDGGQTVESALRAMERRHRHAVGVTCHGRFAGMFTRGDLIHNVIGMRKNPGAIMLEDVMTANPIAVAPDCGLLEAFLILCRNNISHLPVLDGAAFLGIVSDDDMRLKISDDLQKLRQDNGFLLSYLSGHYSASNCA